MNEKDLDKALRIYAKIKHYKDRVKYFEMIEKEWWKCSPGATAYNIQNHLPQSWEKELDEAALKVMRDCWNDTNSKIRCLEKMLFEL